MALEVEVKYGQGDLQRYAKAIGMEHGTLENYRRVARAYEKSRRRENLSFTHHVEVAARPDRLDWLARADAAGEDGDQDVRLPISSMLRRVFAMSDCAPISTNRSRALFKYFRACRTSSRLRQTRARLPRARAWPSL